MKKYFLELHLQKLKTSNGNKARFKIHQRS
jgi:hypothetical protein